MANTGQTAKRRIFSNFFALSGVQMTNMILPLITVPYLMRVLGPDKVGRIAFAQALAQYFVFLTDYGFGYSAARHIAVIRDNATATGACYSNVFTARTLLAIVGFWVFCGVVAAVPHFRADYVLFLSAYAAVFVTVLFPVWAFQGLERLRSVAILNLCSRTLFASAIFVFIHDGNDYYLVPLISAMGGIVAGLISQGLIFGPLKIPLVAPSIRGVRSEFRTAFPHFVSRASVGLYSTSSVFVLGLFTTHTQVGYYSAGERVARVFLQFISCFSASAYPTMSRIASESRTRVVRTLKKMLMYLVPPTAAITILLLILAPYISRVLLGDEFEGSVLVLRILAILPLVRAISGMVGVQGFFAIGEAKAFLRIVAPLSLLHLCIGSVLSYGYGHIGMAAAIVFTDTLIAICCTIVFTGIARPSNSPVEGLRPAKPRYLLSERNPSRIAWPRLPPLDGVNPAHGGSPND